MLIVRATLQLSRRIILSAPHTRNPATTMPTRPEITPQTPE